MALSISEFKSSAHFNNLITMSDGIRFYLQINYKITVVYTYGILGCMILDVVLSEELLIGLCFIR